MNSAILDFGEGWLIRVSMVEGRPMITAQHDDGEMMHASSVWASMGNGSVQFLNWHQECHSTREVQSMAKDKVILAKTETVYGEEPSGGARVDFLSNLDMNVIRAAPYPHSPQTTKTETIHSFRLDCPNCKCGISVELRTEN